MSKWIEKGIDANLLLSWWGWHKLPVTIGEVLTEVRGWTCTVDDEGICKRIRVKCAIKKTAKGYKIWWPTFYKHGKFKVHEHLLLPNS